MKSLIKYLFFTVLVTSCSNKEEVKEPTLDVNSEKWELVKTTGNFMGSETTGEDMEWQEYYIFNSDATFFKSRDWDNAVKEASGKYAKEVLDGQEYLELVYSSGEELIGNCTGDNKEQLFYKKGDVLRGNWGNCDGPILEYKQLKK
ncbi:hypothetical protein CLV91_1198 [Maribacter vaceletii]|uniref:Lipocalin-like protein n=1 Tax=Maribacter vaceletii TaxID=1206816 RepID=A0A495EEE2_9FLAO|nr:hypothetical protein [Maribacter vaceletii]RKR15116.1 hypothetical protein CLV91_1198 [Maribacter vaceletii]